jgi:hypothetical protein
MLFSPILCAFASLREILFRLLCAPWRADIISRRFGSAKLSHRFRRIGRVKN